MFKPLPALAVLAAFSLSSCYLSQTYLTVSETGRSYDIASLPPEQKQTVWKKDGFYIVRASLSRYNKQYKAGEYITPAFGPSNKCRYDKLSSPSPIEGYLKLTPDQFSLITTGTGASKESMKFTWLAPEDFQEEKTLELPAKYAIRHDMVSCGHYTHSNFYPVAVQEEWYYALMQPVAFLDGIFIDVPVSIIGTPIFWIYRISGGTLPEQE